MTTAGSLQEMGFDLNDDGVGSKGNRLKLKEGDKFRVSFAWWPGLEDGKPVLDSPSPRFLGGKRLYLAGVGYFMDRGPEYVKIAGSPSKMQIGTVIIKWPTDSSGAIDKAKFASGDFKAMSWIISGDKYQNLKTTNSEWPLGSYDLNIACTDTQYQKITISPCRESLLRKILEKDPVKAAAIIAQAKAVAEGLPGELAQDLTIEQIRAKLAGGPVGARPTAGSGAAPASSPDFDNMLEDILK